MWRRRRCAVHPSASARIVVVNAVLENVRMIPHVARRWALPLLVPTILAVLCPLEVQSLPSASTKGTQNSTVKVGGGGNDDEYFTLPEGFLLGAGTSAIQVEGGYLEDGRTLSVTEYMMEIPADSPYALPVPMQVPKVTADSYHRYMEDVEMAAALKLKVYRFSVSWSRIFPDDSMIPNQKGVRYYNNLINALLSKNIQPLVTMHHFDYPLWVLKKSGGWANKAIVQEFVKFADFLFAEFGDRVKLWSTINEANFYCMTYATLPVQGMYESQPGDDYKCIHHAILSHMRTYRLYEEKYRKQQQGQIGAAALSLWNRPNSTKYDDIQAAERANFFSLGSIYHPVVHGDYPPTLRQRVDYYSALEGRNVSRLPSFTDEEKQLLKGSADFLCFNAYMGTTMADGSHLPRPAGGGTIQSDRDAIEVNRDLRPGHFGNLFSKAEPWVLREAPLWIRDNYNNTPLFITENGWADEREGADPHDDEPRVGYHSEYLYELVRTVKEENVNVAGYIIWSLIDTYEWSQVFSRKFGLVHVDYEGGSLNRSLKNSAWFFQEIGTSGRVKRVPFTYDPDASSGTISAPAKFTAAFLLLAHLLFNLMH